MRRQHEQTLASLWLAGFRAHTLSATLLSYTGSILIIGLFLWPFLALLKNEQAFRTFPFLIFLALGVQYFCCKTLSQGTGWLAAHTLRRAGRLKSQLGGTTLRGRNLMQTDLSQADLRRANLKNANLYRANLHRARLYQANLHRATLSYAVLTEADLIEADLTYADLTGANLHGAHLEGAQVYGSTLDRASRLDPTWSRADFRHPESGETDTALIERIRAGHRDFFSSETSGTDLDNEAQGLSAYAIVRTRERQAETPTDPLDPTHR